MHLQTDGVLIDVNYCVKLTAQKYAETFDLPINQAYEQLIKRFNKNFLAFFI